MRCPAVYARLVRKRKDPRAESAPPNFGLSVPTSSAFTVEGQIEREVALLAGAKRMGGWKKWVVYSFYLLGAVAVLWTVIAQTVMAFG
jgi:hypothetical protein